ncbi:MAG TPA: hypothetical protein ENH82_14645 [bacterium]|nr:hypothetical protein [bacterium]
MSWRKYTVEGYSYTGDEDVTFASLTAIGDVTVPTFDSIPFVTVIASTGVKAKAKNITASGFRLERVRGGFSSNLSKTGTLNFRIFGES